MKGARVKKRGEEKRGHFEVSVKPGPAQPVLFSYPLNFQNRFRGAWRATHFPAQ
jgi:hypothetical protein